MSPPPPTPRPRSIHVALVLTAPLLLGPAGCGTGSEPPPESARSDPDALPALGPDARVDPEIAERVARALEAARASEPGAILHLANVYAANSLFDLAARTYTKVPGAADDARVQFHLGRSLAADGRPEDALAAFARSAELVGDYGPTHWRRGDVLFDLGRLDEAETSYRLALRCEPNSVQATLGLARIHLARDEPQAAVELLDPIAKLDPKTPFVNGLLARAWLRLDRPKRAERALRREEVSKPRSVPDPWTAEVELEATGLLVHLNRASRMLSDGDPNGAIAELEPLLADHAGNDALRSTLARAFTEAGNPERALEVLGPDPGTGSVELARARSLSALGRGEEGVANLERIVARSPEYAEAWEALGEIELGRGHSERALFALGEARRMGRESARLSALTARAALGVGDAERAAEVLRDATELHPRSGPLWASLADAESRAGHLDAARAALGRAVERDPGNPLIPVVRERLSAAEEESR